MAQGDFIFDVKVEKRPFFALDKEPILLFVMLKSDEESQRTRSCRTCTSLLAELLKNLFKELPDDVT